MTPRSSRFSPAGRNSKNRRIKFDSVLGFGSSKFAPAKKSAQIISMQIPRVAFSEGRSLSQVCEALLAGGLDVYKKEGPKYLQRFLFREKKEPLE
jgi:hypothetical protein